MQPLVLLHHVEELESELEGRLLGLQLAIKLLQELPGAHTFLVVNNFQAADAELFWFSVFCNVRLAFELRADRVEFIVSRDARAQRIDTIVLLRDIL